MWIPVNKTTGIQYPPVDDFGRAHYEADPVTKGKYRFIAANPSTASQKNAAAKAAAKEEKIIPVGVDTPNEPEQE